MRVIRDLPDPGGATVGVFFLAIVGAARRPYDEVRMQESR
jgi:hypothetical protein